MIKGVVFDMDGVMNGKIQKFVDELQLVNNMEKLKESEVFCRPKFKKPG